MQSGKIYKCSPILPTASYRSYIEEFYCAQKNPTRDLVIFSVCLSKLMRFENGEIENTVL